jgi:hypothetical protein
MFRGTFARAGVRLKIAFQDNGKNKGKEIFSGSPYENWKPSGHLHVTPGDPLGISL